MNNTRALTILLRSYGIVGIALFTFLFVSFITRAQFLAEGGGQLNWLIWNDIFSHQDHAHVPPMLFIIYMVWSVFLVLASRDPLAYRSFLNFTIWGNAAHGLLMVIQAVSELDRYWSKFLTDIPFILILAAGIYLLQPKQPAPSAK